jgi:HD-GYP domain-containing protein (c-di-GMP phosphodiesterase class II)
MAYQSINHFDGKAQHSELSVQMSDLINCLSGTIDLVSSQLADHHYRVGRIAYALACQLGFPKEERIDLHFAGNLHDIGALSLTDRIMLMSFEGCEPHQHAETGANLLEMFGPLAHLGELVRFHHVNWDHGTGEVQHGKEVPLGSHILHLADRISVLTGIMDGINLLVRVPDIRFKIKNMSGKMFLPVLVEAFNDLSCKESFWLDLAFPGRNQTFERRADLPAVLLDTDGILGLSRMFARIIDFRSHFTSTHSNGVAASAEALARLTGMSSEECAHMRIAGLLHDLGKLAVPAELLEKPGALTVEERALISSHTYFTRWALENISSFETITAWGANHHERIDGQGYPCHIRGDDLHAGSRIMAVADVFTAITEDRPYRIGMNQASTKKVIYDLVLHTALDPGIVDVLMDNFEEINCIRTDAQSEAVREYVELSGKVAAVATGQA